MLGLRTRGGRREWRELPQPATCHLLELLQFLEETEIIDSHISSDVGCQEVRDVEHHSEHPRK